MEQPQHGPRGCSSIARLRRSGKIGLRSSPISPCGPDAELRQWTHHWEEVRKVTLQSWWTLCKWLKSVCVTSKSWKGWYGIDSWTQQLRLSAAGTSRPPRDVREGQHSSVDISRHPSKDQKMPFLPKQWSYLCHFSKYLSALHLVLHFDRQSCVCTPMCMHTHIHETQEKRKCW